MAGAAREGRAGSPTLLVHGGRCLGHNQDCRQLLCYSTDTPLVKIVKKYSLLGNDKEWQILRVFPFFFLNLFHIQHHPWLFFFFFSFKIVTISS